MMTLKELKGAGRMLASFLLLFRSCFKSLAGRKLLRVYVQGLLSDVQRKNCEAIALEFDTCPRTLQRFLESIKWDEEQLRDRCQEVVVRDHAHPDAISLGWAISLSHGMLRCCDFEGCFVFGVGGVAAGGEG